MKDVAQKTNAVEALLVSYKPRSWPLVSFLDFRLCELQRVGAVDGLGPCFVRHFTLFRRFSSPLPAHDSAAFPGCLGHFAFQLEGSADGVTGRVLFCILLWGHRPFSVELTFPFGRPAMVGCTGDQDRSI